MNRATSGRALGCVAWLTAPCIIFLLFSFPVMDVTLTLQVLGVLTLLFGVYAFLHHGGAAMTAAGFFSAGTAAFVGYAALWWANYGAVVDPNRILAVLFCHSVNVLCYFCFWYNWADFSCRETPESSKHLDRYGWLGLTITTLAYALHAIVETGTLMRGVAAIGIALVGISASLNQQRKIHRSPWFYVLVFLLLLYVALMFSGYGRLIVIVLGGTVAAALSLRAKTRWFKGVCVLILPLAASSLTLLRYQRLGFDAPDESAVDSDISGLDVFSQLIGLRDLDFALGETFASSLVAWVPRFLWEDKPFGFGFDLTLLLRPELAPSGHSMVATVFGEYFYNFGWFGLPLAILTLGLLVRFLDSLRTRFATRSTMVTDSSPLVLALILFTSAGMINLVWGGFHSLVSRLLVPSALVFGTVALTRLLYAALRRETAYGSPEEAQQRTPTDRPNMSH